MCVRSGARVQLAHLAPLRNSVRGPLWREGWPIRLLRENLNRLALVKRYGDLRGKRETNGPFSFPVVFGNITQCNVLIQCFPYDDLSKINSGAL